MFEKRKRSIFCHGSDKKNPIRSAVREYCTLNFRIIEVAGGNGIGGKLFFDELTGWVQFFVSLTLIENFSGICQPGQ